MLKTLSYTLYGIPRELALDSPTWFLIFRMLVFPHKDNGAGPLYEQILPYLNQKPLLHNATHATAVDLPGTWQPEPVPSIPWFLRLHTKV
jgi:hypothetical protein